MFYNQGKQEESPAILILSAVVSAFLAAIVTAGFLSGCGGAPFTADLEPISQDAGAPPLEASSVIPGDTALPDAAPGSEASKPVESGADVKDEVLGDASSGGSDAAATSPPEASMPEAAPPRKQPIIVQCKTPNGSAYCSPDSTWNSLGQGMSILYGPIDGSGDPAESCTEAMPPAAPCVVGTICWIKNLTESIQGVCQ